MVWTYEKYSEWITEIIQKYKRNSMSGLEFDNLLLMRFGIDPRTQGNHKKAMVVYLSLIHI